MTKQIPLSLQVFHSRSEYEAQRLNRTEQIRLRDFHDVLKREEKLYVKDHALYRQKFNSHYLRRRSEPWISSTSNSNSNSSCSGMSFHRGNSSCSGMSFHRGNSSCSGMSFHRGNSSTFSRSDSLSSRASLFSAPGKLQTNRTLSLNDESSLASRMCSSMGEISTMTGFQRIQRKFSFASFTEHGLLTARGSKMANNIDQVRKVLFRNNGNSVMKVKQKAMLKRIADETVGQEEKPGKEEEEEEDYPNGSEIESRSNNNIDMAENRINKNESSTSETTKSLSTNKDLSLSQSVSNGTARGERTEFERGDTERSVYSLDVMDNSSSRRRSATQHKKRVTIQWNKSVLSRDDNESITDLDASGYPTQNNVSVIQANEPSKDFREWRSILSRKVKNLDPLQQRINLFLADQSDFNRVFPKNFDGVPKTSALQKELADIGREKREREKKDRKKKNEIVLEVLNKLGIEDENILSNYQDCE